jgi:hypothetical protein
MRLESQTSYPMEEKMEDSFRRSWREVAPYLFVWTALSGLGVFLTEVVGITF